MSHIHIVIDTVEGGGDGQDLMGCYFEYKANDTYKFFDKNGNKLASHLSIGSTFTFPLYYYPNSMFQLTIGPGSDSMTVNGTWANLSNATASNIVWDPDQSYQAQAGGTGECDEVDAVVMAT